MDAIVRERAPQDYALALLERRAQRGANVAWAIEAIKTLGGEHAAAAE
jgi:hypothetical protein